jgi:uncharacterized repeat protein (TIGR01451 family)
MTGSSATGWMLDTTCPVVLSVGYIDCSFSNINDLTGIQYFANLTNLHCGGNHITSLPVIPPGVTTIECSGNQMTVLSTLPASLTYLDCSNNLLTVLPALPVSLTSLACNNNLLTVLPSLPASLTGLSCNTNHLTVLPALPISLTGLYCGINRITVLPVLPTSLTSLDCSDNQLTVLPALPGLLTDLDCSSNQITVLPSLPASLTSLDCGENQLTGLPTLPTSLINLSCDINQITGLPALPTSLTHLDCSDNQLTFLFGLPTSLTYLDCSANRLTVLYTLPTSLINFYCDFNQLSALPTLPASLQLLYCVDNQLTSLPSLLSTSLYTLECNWNQLTSLPSLPRSLFNIECHTNALTSLPDVSGVTYLDCSDNPALSCLPRLNSDIQQLDVSYTAITCLPNRVSPVQTDINLAYMPLCTPASGCDFYYNIAGDIHQDTAIDCITDSLYPGNALSNIKVQLLYNGQVQQQFYAFNSGGYSFKPNSLVSYTVTIDTTGLPLSIACPVSGTHQAILSVYDSVSVNNNFGLACTGSDYSVNGIYVDRLRPGFSSYVNVSAGNRSLQFYNLNCGPGIAGTVTISLPSSLNYTGPASGALTPASVSGGILTYNVADLNSLNYGSLSIIFTTDGSATLGSSACITATIQPSTPDINPGNNTLTQCFVITGSYDPNYKAVSPIDTCDRGEWLTYTVEFQNTGTDTAYTVIVKDTLSQNIDASSFQYLASDHKAVIQLFGNAMVFTFPKINLVDSATNPALSTGWIQYRVRAKINLAGRVIKNTAYIYFDNNPAVATNTVINTVNCTDTTIYTSHIICSGDSLLFYHHYFHTSGTYTDTLTRTSGCDSIIFLSLTVLSVHRDTTAAPICGGSSYTFAGHNISIGGTYADTIHYSLGCDSIISVLTLTVVNAHRDTTHAAICAGSSYTFAGHSISTTGTYADTIQNSLGCDSIISVLTLTVINTQRDTIITTICGGSSYSFAGHSIDTAGIYTDTIQNTLGCDSIISVLTLTVANAHRDTTTATICAGSSYPFAGHSISMGGTYADTIPGVFGCDSIISVLNLTTVLYGSTTTASICEGGSYPFAGHSITTAGIYTDSLQSAQGCDSIDVLRLTVLPLPAPVINVYSVSSYDSLTTDHYQHYQWVKDGLGSPADTLPYYLVSVPPSVQINVIVADSNGCTGTSAATGLIWIGIHDINDTASVLLYPNPNTGTFTLQTAHTHDASYSIYDMIGNLVAQRNIVSDHEIISLPGMATGVYTLIVRSGTMSQQIRFTIE